MRRRRPPSETSRDQGILRRPPETRTPPATPASPAPRGRARPRSRRRRRPLGRELHRAVQLGGDPTTEPIRQQSDADQGGADRLSGGERNGSGRARRIEHRSSHATQRDVGSPLALRSDAIHGSDDPPGRDQDPQVVSLRSDELLDYRIMPPEPTTRPHAGQGLRERREVVAAVHLPAPAPVARLQHDREQRLGYGSPGPDVDRRRWTTSRRRSTRAVRSLSCAASSAAGSFKTWTPRAASAPSAQRRSSMPSSLGSTSRRPSAASPGCRTSSARRGVIGSQLRPSAGASDSASFVGVDRAGDERKSHDASVAAARAGGQGASPDRYRTPTRKLLRPVGLVGSRP